MSWNDGKPTLRELFAQMRREDARSAPSFARLTAGVRRQSRRRPLWAPVAAATGFAAAAACWLLVSFRPPPPAGPTAREVRPTPITAVAFRQIQTLSEWEAPTDTLLANSATTALTRFQASTDALLDIGSADLSATSLE